MTDTDYAALLEDTDRKMDCCDHIEAFNMMARLADATKSLLGERDALRAQLDSMTTEWGAGYAADELNRPIYKGDDADDARAYTQGRGTEGPSGFHTVSRLVGPWVEVTD